MASVNKKKKSEKAVKNTKIINEEHPYKNIDLKFIDKYKERIIEHIYNFAGEYLELIRPSNEKNVIMDSHAKDQIMYIFYKLIGITKKMDDNVPEDIPSWVEDSLDTSSSDYRIYRFLHGVTNNHKYNLMGNPIEEETLCIIAEFIEDEDIMQYTVEMFLLFIKKFAESIANFNWEATKKTNGSQVNGLLRNMNNNNTNPAIFTEIYEFGNYYKAHNKKK